MKSLPKEPPPGLLVSMAMRFNHALLMSGYYGAPYFSERGGSDKKHMEQVMRAMRQAYEEVSGQGFYRPELEASYAAFAPNEKAKQSLQIPKKTP